MALAYRSDFYGLDFMPEATFGTDPGIVAATYVTSTEKYVPSTGNGKKAWARLAAAPSGLPKIGLVEVTHTKQVRDYSNKRVVGLKSEGELTLTMHVHGGYDDAGIFRMPPWLQLAASSSGRIINGIDSTPAITVAGTPSVDTLQLSGSTPPAVGAFYGVNVTGSGIEVVRPRTVSSQNATEIIPNFTTAPTSGDTIRSATFAIFDKREEANTESFTMLLHRSNQDSALMFKGCRCTGWTWTENVGELGVFEAKFAFSSFSVEGDAGSEWSGYSGITAEPSYYATAWPLPTVVKASGFVQGEINASAGAVPIHVSGVKVEWQSGYQKHMASTGDEGVAEIYATGQQRGRMTFTMLYLNDARGGIFDGSTPPVFTYYRTPEFGKGIFVHIPAGITVEDPGYDGEQDGNQAMTFTVEAGDYTDDTGSYSAGSPIDNIFAIGIL